MDKIKYNALIEAIYDSAINPSNWLDTIEKISSAFNSQSAGLFLQTADQQFGGGVLFGYDADYIDLYEERFAADNPWFVTPGLMAPGKISTDQSLETLHNDRKAFHKTAYYQEWFLPQDHKHTMGINLIDNHGDRLNFTFLRSKHDGYFSSTEMQDFKSISRHISKATEINSRLERSKVLEGANETVLNNLKMGVVYLGSFGGIEFVNDYARKLIYGDNGLFERASQLRALDHSTNRLLSAAIAKAYTKRKSSIIPVQRPQKSALSVSIIPTSGSRSFLGCQNNYVVIFITDPDDRRLDVATYLQERWKLAPVEADFAQKLLQGFSVNDIADKLFMTRHTARWYSKQIMRKLDVNRQNDLIIKLMSDLSSIVTIEH